MTEYTRALLGTNIDQLYNQVLALGFTILRFNLPNGSIHVDFEETLTAQDVLDIDALIDGHVDPIPSDGVTFDEDQILSLAERAGYSVSGDTIAYFDRGEITNNTKVTTKTDGSVTKTVHRFDYMFETWVATVNVSSDETVFSNPVIIRTPIT